MSNFPLNENQKSAPHFDFGWRETAILILIGIPALLCAFIAWLPAAWMPARIGLAVLLADIALVWAFGRDPNSEATIEKKVWDWILARFSSRTRPVKPGIAMGADRMISENLGAIKRWKEYSRPSVASPWTYQPIHINSMLLLQGFSYATLAAIIAWLVTGGTHEVIRWMQLSFR
jgi:hypothetical protein